MQQQPIRRSDSSDSDAPPKRYFARFLRVWVATLALGLAPEGAHCDDAVYSQPSDGQFMKEWLIRDSSDLGDHLSSDVDRKAKLYESDLLDGEEETSGIKPGKQWKYHASKANVVELEDIADGKLGVAYVSSLVRSQGESKIVLGVGSSCGIKVWLNGKLVHEHWGRRTLRSDDDLARVTLRDGDNRLLLKIVKQQDDWAFSCRFLGERQLTKELVTAAVKRDEDRIKDLVAVGADINGRTKEGLTPYLAAKIEGNDRIAQVLSVLGAKTDSEFDPQALIKAIVGDETGEGLPGIAMLISRGDEILYEGAFGYADLAHDVPVTPETKFRIGSVSKQFTAAAILKLQEQEKLSVNDSLAKFIPDFPRGDEVTLHHLLTHTSGLKNYTSKPNFYETVAASADKDDMLEQFKEDGFDSEPGEKFAYCNTGYFLLGYIVEQVSGMSFEEYLRATFFSPLGMDDTGVHEATDLLKHEAVGYSMDGKTVTKALDWDMSRAGGAGNLYSTVRDLHRWNQAVFNGEVLSDESLAAAHQVYKTSSEGELEMPYGYGWMVDEHRGLKRIGHSGGLQGFVSHLNRYPEQNVTVVALHNAFPSVPGLSPQAACDALAKAFLWPEMKPRPQRLVAADVDPETYEDYVGRYDYPGAVMTVSRDGDRILAQITGQPKFEIFPAGDDEFFWKVVNAQVQFTRDDAGRVSHARHAQGFVKFSAAKIEEFEPIELADDVLDRYVGKYDYGSAKLTIRRQGKQLFAKMTGQTEFELFAKSETELHWRAVHARLELTVDDDGKVIKATHYQSGQEIPVEKID